MHVKSNLDFPDAAGRAPEKQFCFSPEGADSPYETYFPIACTTVPCLQPIGLACIKIWSRLNVIRLHVLRYGAESMY